MASVAHDLFAAIAADDVATVRAIVDEDPALATARDEYGVSALMNARYRMDMALTDAVLRHVPALDVFEAAAFGDVDRLTAIVEEDPAAVTLRSGDGFTALHLAAFFGGPSARRRPTARQSCCAPGPIPTPGRPRAGPRCTARRQAVWPTWCAICWRTAPIRRSPTRTGRHRSTWRPRTRSVPRSDERYAA